MFSVNFNKDETHFLPRGEEFSREGTILAIRNIFSPPLTKEKEPEPFLVPLQKNLISGGRRHRKGAYNRK